MEIIKSNDELHEIAQRIRFGVASEDDYTRIKVEDVYAVKSDPEGVFLRTTVKAPEDAGERRKRYIANEQTRDRAGDIINQSGWDHKDFKKNPVALWAHNDSGFPIGTVEDIEVGEGKRGIPTLFQTIKYLDADVSEEADKVWKLVNAGVIKAVSVGFMPTKVRVPKNEGERKELGLGTFGVLYEKQAQLELSNCSIPMHQNALATKSMVTEALGDLVKSKKITRAEAAELEKLAERLEEGEAKVFAVGAVPVSADDETPCYGGSGLTLDESAAALNTLVGDDANELPQMRSEYVAVRSLADAVEAQADTIKTLRAEANLAERIKEMAECIRALTSRVEQMHEELSTVKDEGTDVDDEDDPGKFLGEIAECVRSHFETE
jgi:phage head maturation protease